MFSDHKSYFKLGRFMIIPAVLLIAACATTSPAVGPTMPPEAGQVDSPADTPALQAIPSTPTSEPLGFWIQPGVPQTIVDNVSATLTQAGYVQAGAPDGTILQVVLDPGPGAALTAQWVYTVAAPFATVPDSISLAELQGYWQGSAGAISGFEVAPNVVISPDVADLLISRFGAMSAGLPVTLVDSGALTDSAWNARPAISILPFEQLEPRWKILPLDGLSVLDKTLDINAYPLTVRVGVIPQGDAGLQAVNVLQVNEAWQATNRDPNQMSIVVLTGVTALVRSTAMQMELRGYTFPAENILPFFADADILHTSNEVSFAIDCPEPEWTGDPEGFCSSRDYYALLDYIGLDIVELTGNHLNDRGTVPLSYTLDVYDGNQMPYYGGGRDLTDATQARILTAPNGTRFAFIGCNSAGPFAAWATDASPGAAPCDDWAAITQRIAGLKANNEADVVITTLQYLELDQYDPSPEQVADFNQLAAAGADIVSGSQAHQPQGFGFVDGSFIHYGVGNLFFDQMDYIENRQMFADKHVFYGDKHISTVLFTGMMEDWAQPRPMTPEERAEFLQLIFDVSPW